MRLEREVGPDPNGWASHREVWALSSWQQARGMMESRFAILRNAPQLQAEDDSEGKGSGGRKKISKRPVCEHCGRNICMVPAQIGAECREVIITHSSGRTARQAHQGLLGL